MMACVANRILATPFAVVGSIGVIAQVPNLNKLLKKHDVDYREVTAGEFKRTVTMFGEIHQTGLDKFKEQIEGTHQLFKQFVKENRPALDIQRVATGEHWFGTEALALGLVDELITSDEYISRCAATADVYRIEFQAPKKWLARVTDSAAQSAHQMLGKVISDFELRRFGL